MVEVDYYDQYEGSTLAEDPVVEEEEEYDETGTRNTWAILTWIMLALTILLNLVLIGILVVKRNLRSIMNKSEFYLTNQLRSSAHSCAKKPPFAARSDITPERARAHLDPTATNIKSVFLCRPCYPACKENTIQLKAKVEVGENRSR